MSALCFKDGNLKKLRDFSFKDCGGKIAHAHSLMVTPDPLQFPGTFNLGFNVSVTADLVSPLQVSKQRKKAIRKLLDDCLIYIFEMYTIFHWYMVVMCLNVASENGDDLL